MYENQSNPAEFELYEDPRTGEPRLRRRPPSVPPQGPNPGGALVSALCRALQAPAGWNRPITGPRNVGLRPD